jgi:hypothetical protein
MYEIWEITNDGYEMFPLIMIKKFDFFGDAYVEFQKLVKTTPCCIVLNKGEKNETI